MEKCGLHIVTVHFNRCILGIPLYTKCYQRLMYGARDCTCFVAYLSFLMLLLKLVLSGFTQFSLFSGFKIDWFGWDTDS